MSAEVVALALRILESDAVASVMVGALALRRTLGNISDAFMVVVVLVDFPLIVLPVVVIGSGGSLSVV